MADPFALKVFESDSPSADCLEEDVHKFLSFECGGQIVFSKYPLFWKLPNPLFLYRNTSAASDARSEISL
jgi:hypothetical protein